MTDKPDSSKPPVVLSDENSVWIDTSRLPKDQWVNLAIDDEGNIYIDGSLMKND